MDNSSYRSQYIQSGNENFSEQSVSVYDAFWKRLEKQRDLSESHWRMATQQKSTQY